MAMLLTVGQAAAAEINSDNDIVHLQILTINDFHGSLAENGKNPGAAKLAEYLIEAKAQNPSVLLVSAGDMFQGSPDSNLLYGKTVVDVMNYVKFDVMTLGNHEFDWGIDILKQRIAQSKFPYVCANVIDRITGKPVDFVKPYILLERNGVKIGVIGIATPETAYKTNPKVVSGFIFEDPAKVVNALVPEIKQQGAAVIVVLTHLASWMDGNGNISGDAADFALQTSGIDAVVSGHSHQTVYGKVNGVPVVQAYYNGRAVGKIELLFNKSSHKVEDYSVGVTTLPYPGLKANSGVQAMLDQAQTGIAAVKNIVVGHTVHGLSHDRNELTETLLGQWVTDTMRQAVGADIAFQNSGGLRTGIPAGIVSMGNLYEVMPFDNTLITVDMTGKQVMSVLEYGLMNNKIGMVQYSGIRVSYEATGPQGGHISAVTMSDGTPLGLEKNYKVVTNDFMAAGGDGFTVFQEGKNLHDTAIPVRDILSDSIRTQKVIDFVGDDRWDVTPTAEQRQQDAA
jgi:2',3'-cyclic-nucleotide 2'-phosphodiesterase/3'-nucleotidase